jgi:transcriptional antiterminator RfaH
LFENGQSIRLVGGPLRGMEGIFEQADGEQRAMVLIELLNKQHRIQADLQHIRPASL